MKNWHFLALGGAAVAAVWYVKRRDNKPDGLSTTVTTSETPTPSVFAPSGQVVANRVDLISSTSLRPFKVADSVVSSPADAEKTTAYTVVKSGASVNVNPFGPTVTLQPDAYYAKYAGLIAGRTP